MMRTSEREREGDRYIERECLKISATIDLLSRVDIRSVAHIHEPVELFEECWVDKILPAEG